MADPNDHTELLRDPANAAVVRSYVRLADTAVAGATSGFAQLAPELRAVAGRRLKNAALAYGGVWVLMFVAGYANSLFLTHCPFDWQWGVRTAVALLLSVIVVTAVRQDRVPPSRFLAFAITFEFLGSLLIASADWGWETMAASQLAALQAGNVEGAGNGARFLAGNGIHWSGAWLLLFPLLVPTPRREAVVGAFLAATAVPLVFLSSALVHGMPPELEPFLTGLYFWTFVSLYVAAAMAVFGARVVYRLTRDLSEARELGSYRLTALIGRGGMGEVWKASHRLLARPAAVKLIRAEAMGKDPAARSIVQARFEREAQATANLQSPHTVELYDFGIEADGTFFYVMELLDGADLQSLVQRFGPMPPERVAYLLEQACHSLTDAHERGLVHRDIKPANIFICRRAHEVDFVKVLDFGLVTRDRGRASATDPQLTADGSISGTPAYMAPEMAMGTGELDGRTDLYSLGCVGYWLITGQLVFEGRTPMEMLVQHAKETPVAPSQRSETTVPAALDRIILECLAKRPEERLPSARAMAAALRECRSSMPDWDQERAQRWWQMHLPSSPTASPVV